MKLEVVFTLLATVFYIIAWIVLLAGFGWCTTSHDKSSTICDARVAAGVRERDVPLEIVSTCLQTSQS